MLKARGTFLPGVIEQMSQTIQDLVSVRQLEAADLPFLLNSSITCLSKYTESFAKGYNPIYFAKLVEKQMLYVLNDTNVSTFICSNKDDSQSIIAYIIANTKLNHIYFQYTKYAYRKMGIQKHMLLPLVTDPELRISVQWPTKEMLRLVKRNSGWMRRDGSLVESKVQIENKLVEQLLELTI